MEIRMATASGLGDPASGDWDRRKAACCLEGSGLEVGSAALISRVAESGSSASIAL